MIEYYKGAYGLNLLFRFHGSAVYKAFIPGLVSSILFAVVRIYFQPGDINGEEVETLDHPYAIGVLVGSVSFLIIFRANNSYQRYWEGCGAVHQMMSKLLDATVHTAAYHMQCDHYASIKPPSFFDYPQFLGSNLSITREKGKKQQRKSINAIYKKKSKSRCNCYSNNHIDTEVPASLERSSSTIFGDGHLDGGWGLLFSTNGKIGDTLLGYDTRKEYTTFGDTPSLFLRELAHLSSLLVAVAFCTLRNDIDGVESPLGVYTPGQPWPAADPDRMSREEKSYQQGCSFCEKVCFWLGFERTPEYRTRYNATRPMLVIGGVSDNEIALLQKARGASAKTTLTWYWLSEFIVREHLAGSTGNVGPPIISRIFQFLSDAMISYNHARKIMYIPFPFPHAQISALYIIVMVGAVPYMMNQYANAPWLGAVLTFFTVSCLAGLHEVGRELENPFRNTPNEVPLVSLLAQYNESLIAMCTGYHPDAFWKHSIPPQFSNEDKLETSEDNEIMSDDKVLPPQSTSNDLCSITQLQETVLKQAIEIGELKNIILSMRDGIHDDTSSFSKKS